MAPCPSSPNCVCSDSTDAAHAVQPFRILGEASVVWPKLCDAVAAAPRVRVVKQTDVYLHAECRTRLLRFTDDLELRLRADEGVVAVRSASRVGYSDLGKNRRRVEKLRGLLRERGLVG
ncbi:MAG: DUF1499 domain-containing protein [Deltaproteobacteria bacterium]|nr:DUF1499 domain-containing protein [Deltaproteobacteria bacterium]